MTTGVQAMREDMTQELERKAWDAVGIMQSAGLNILDCIEHFTYFLFLKLQDDRERQIEQADPTYRTRLGDDRWRFHHWIGLPEYELPHFISQSLFPYLAHLPDLPNVDNSDVRMIFTDAYLLLREPEPLWRVLTIIQTVDLQSYDVHVAGGLFESLLAKMSSEGIELGQFYTQRHLVNLMVDLVDPQIGEMIYDPASGTGGFLVRTYEHLQDTLDAAQQDYSEKLHFLREETIHGRERNRRVCRLGIINMILHGVGYAHMLCDDSLQPDAQEHNRYDVIFTNPPFGYKASPGPVRDFFPIQTPSVEALFLQHIMLCLKPGGRAAMIVSEGTLFKDGAEQRIRKLLLEDFSVEAVISLPPGVFSPYTSVKASILVFRKDDPAQQIWFFEVSNDGFELTASRRPIPGRSDLDVLRELWDTKPETKQSWWAEVARVVEMDYVLSANRYMPIQASQSQYPLIHLRELLQYHSEWITLDDDKLYTQVRVKHHGAGVELRDQMFGHQIRTKKQKRVRAGQLIVSAIGAKSGAFGIVPPELDGAIASRDYHLYDVLSKDVLPAYLALSLSHESVERDTQSFVRGSTSLARVNHKDFLKLRIPLPPLEKQREIVSRLEDAELAVKEAEKHYEEVRRDIELDIFGTSAYQPDNSAETT